VGLAGGWQVDDVGFLRSFPRTLGLDCELSDPSIPFVSSIFLLRNFPSASRTLVTVTTPFFRRMPTTRYNVRSLNPVLSRRSEKWGTEGSKAKTAPSLEGTELWLFSFLSIGPLSAKKQPSRGSGEPTGVLIPPTLRPSLSSRSYPEGEPIIRPIRRMSNSIVLHAVQRPLEVFDTNLNGDKGMTTSLGATNPASHPPIR
jgi:hypothetical protein